MTISMLSSERLTRNNADNEPVDVPVMAYSNRYVYDASNLWLSHGIAVGVTLIGLAFGAGAITPNEAAYSNRFSTMLRPSRNRGFDELVDYDDDGSDPLPKRITAARLCQM